jgi:hypothetical protein
MPTESRGPNRTRSSQEGWPRWMYFAVPALVLFVVLGLWWALFSPPGESAASETPSPTRPVAESQPTQGPTEQPTLPAFAPTATTVLPTLAPPTPTQDLAETDEPEEDETETAPLPSLTIGDMATVCCTGGTGLRMRSGAGTGHPVVKMLTEDKVVEVVGGPQEANGYTWWQVRDEVGTSGWVAAEFLRKQE